MSHAVETMAWRNEVPWHGLGVQVSGIPSVDEMIKAAGLDWEVRQYPMFANVAGEFVPVKQRQALVRETDKKILTVTGPNWNPLQNKEMFEFFREFTEAGNCELETAGSLHGGRVIWALASIKHGFTLKGGDAVRGYILFISPHEVGKSILLRTTAIRVVCANTLAMAMNSGVTQYSQNHLTDFNHDAAKAAVGMAKDQLDQFEKDAKKLSKLELSDFDTMRVLAPFFVDQPDDRNPDEWIGALLDDADLRGRSLNGVIDSLYDAPGALPNTGWGVLNAVTHWADHSAGNKADARLLSAWSGERMTLKTDVLEKLMELVA